MIKFEYDNIEADKLILQFKCEKCDKLTETDLLSIPQLDIDTMSKTKLLHQHKCACGEIYSINIYNGIDDNYGIVNGIDGSENDVYVHEVSDYFYNRNSIWVDTIGSYSKIESIIDKIDEMSNENKGYLYSLLFSNLISILDSFIKIYTEPIIISNNELIDRFSNVFNMSKGNIEKKKQKISDFYKRKSFQSVSNQKKLFYDVFYFDIVIDERIKQYVTIRDVIIHRNAIDSKGFIYKIKKSLLLQALDIIKKYIHQIHDKLRGYEIAISVDKNK